MQTLEMLQYRRKVADGSTYFEAEIETSKLTLLFFSILVDIKKINSSGEFFPIYCGILCCAERP